MTCPVCGDTGHVCENHPDRVWGGLCCIGQGVTELCEHGACFCGAGMPCPACCDPVEPDPRRSILEAFTPRHLKASP